MNAGYSRPLDGLRALAVLLVVFFHAGWLRFGWIGVQIFFVLSGYLITTGLLESRGDSVGAYLKRFYGRRALRIFPLYYAYLAVIALAAAVVALLLLAVLAHGPV